MREIPLLLSTPMVQATLDDRKSQTRRTRGLDYINESPDQWEFINTSDKLDFPRPADCKHPEDPWYLWNDIHNNGKSFISQCPYGQPGDILWVRETWLRNHMDFALLVGTEWCYKTDVLETKRHLFRWKPSIHMPKAACRIKLEVTDVRVERLQDISEEDAKAEGVYYYGWDDHHQDDYKNYLYDDKDGDDWGVMTARESYETLWESINGKGSWNKNPWVWVIKFKQH